MVTALIGYGELGKQIEQLLIEVKKKEKFIYFDDIAYSQKMGNSLPFNNYKKSEFKGLEFYVCLGYRNLVQKMEIIRELHGLNYKLPSIIHPSCYVNKTANIGKNVYLYPLSNIDRNVQIKDGSLINNSVVISHDTIVGAGCYISPGTIISGFVKIGDGSFIGSGSVISNNITIGMNSKIGIGTVVTKDIPGSSSYIGNPMKKVSDLYIA
jgi:sugar O-acyltransferase (sialic acid O-acetyltransferase NeuD family)